VKLKLTFTVTSNSGQDIQFNDGSWTHLTSFIINGIEKKSADYNPNGTVGTEYNITVTFNQSVFNTLCQKGMIIQGSNVTIKKAVLEGTAIVGITPLVIDRPVDNNYYNLWGQRVTNPQKGIYIHNGKKYIAK
jgi:hypothetical protein